MPRPRYRRSTASPADTAAREAHQRASDDLEAALRFSGFAAKSHPAFRPGEPRALFFRIDRERAEAELELLQQILVGEGWHADHVISSRNLGCYSVIHIFHRSQAHVALILSLGVPELAQSRRLS